MIPNHKQFIEAISEKKKVWVRFYSKADSGVLDRVCAPMDYGPGGETQDGVNCYWLWNYASNTGTHTLGLLPQQIVDLQVLGEVFNPADFGVRPSPWSVPRDWGSDVRCRRHQIHHEFGLGFPNLPFSGIYPERGRWVQTGLVS